MAEQNLLSRTGAVSSPHRTTTSRLSRFRRDFRSVWVGYLFILPAVLFLFILIVYPVVLTFQMSTSDIGSDLSFEWVGFKNYVELLNDEFFWHSVVVTAGFTAITVLMHIVVGMVFALLLNHEWPSRTLRNSIRGLLILPWVFSSAASAVMWALLLHPFGTLSYMARAWLGAPGPIEWLGTPTSALLMLAIVNLWKSYPFYMVIILGGLQSIPTDLYEAAKVDGAGFWQSFWRITLPIMRPVLVAISVIDIIGTIAMYDLVRMLTDGGPRRATETVAYYLWRKTFLDGRIDLSAAISIVLLVGLVILIGVYLRLMARGGLSEGTSF